MDKQQQIPVRQVVPPAGVEPPRGGRLNPGSHVYVRSQPGRWQRLRRRMNSLLMLLFVLLPWIPYQGQQAVRLDLASQQFHFFGTTLWPQDLTILAWVFMGAAFALFFVTSYLGRVWCGYLCPQTVWTLLFIWFEERFEGAANKRRKLDQAPWDWNKLWRKACKHGAWLAVSLLTGISFMAYFWDARQLVADVFTLQASFWAFFWVLFFAAATYANAGWMRSIVCTHMCPYARFQSAMFDRDTYTVGYDVARGEPRGARSRKQDPKALGLGDCIDCSLCVQVCPADIDIRNGLQYECINCGACVDACDQTMAHMGYAPGLISYTSEQRLAGGQTRLLRAKLLGYGLVLLIMLGVLVYNLLAVMPMGLEVLRDRNQLYREDSEGLIENTYTLKIMNKSQHAQRYSLEVKGLSEVQWLGPRQVTVAAGEVYNLPISLAVEPEALPQPMLDIEFVLHRQDAAPGESKTELHQPSKFISGL